MKFKKLFLLLVIFISVNLLGNPPGWYDGGGSAPWAGDGDGDTPPDTSSPTPIDTNKAVLVITAVLIAGATGYRRTSLKKA